MTKTKWLAAICLVALTGATEAQAQMISWEDRGYIAVNFGLQAASREFTEVARPTIYNERATITVPHTVSSGGLFDIAAGYRVWQNLAISLGFSQFGDSEAPTLTGDIPNPFFGGAHRVATGSAGDLSHNEQAIHVHAYFNIPLTEKFELALVGGPSFYSIKQDFIADVTPVEGAFPFTTVTIGNVAQTTQKKRATGFTVGADGTYLLTPRYGVGVFGRFSGASVELPAVGGDSPQLVTVDAGGFQLGGGLRVRF
jgi:hypothetical protein